MAYLLCYTKRGEGCYPEHNYPGHKGYNCDWEHAVHLAVSDDGCSFRPLRNNTGILFAKSSFAENAFVGVTKTLVDPWIFRAADGSFFVSAVRRNRNAADSERCGCMAVYHSKDLVHYEEPVFVRLAGEEVRRPRCRYEAETGAYYVEWETESGLWGGSCSSLCRADGKTARMEELTPGEDCGAEADVRVEKCFALEARRLELDAQETDACGAGAQGSEVCGAGAQKADVCGAGVQGTDVCSVGVQGTDVCGAGVRGSEVCSPATDGMQAGDFGIEGCVPGNVIEITQEEKETLCGYFDEIRFVGVEPIRLEWPVGKALPETGTDLEACVPADHPVDKRERGTSANLAGESAYRAANDTSGEMASDVMSDSAACLPGAVCRYSDGSTHEKQVCWDPEALARVDVSRPGVWKIPGTIRQKRWEFPLPLKFLPDEPKDFVGMSDPCVTEYRGKYYLSSSGSQSIQLRIADTVEGTFAAEPVVIYRVPLNPGVRYVGTWAAELHEIDGVLYLFTALCENGDWEQVKSCILRCKGDPADPASWEAPQLCVKRDGSLLTEGGISLDMTYFRDGGKDYVMWSDRKMCYDTGALEAGTADIYIATVDQKEPYRLTSEPCCVVRPMYGWDRYETEVDEGPYLLRHMDELFVTVSGSSTGMGDLYDVGVLRAKSGADLLRQENWTWIPYPLLTKESVPGEYGPGHNNFVKDPDTGDDLMVYHAIPHDAQDRTLQRQPGIRRVHWAKSGLPYLEMTPERDLPEGSERVVMELVVK